MLWQEGNIFLFRIRPASLPANIRGPATSLQIFPKQKISRFFPRISHTGVSRSSLEKASVSRNSSVTSAANSGDAALCFHALKNRAYSHSTSNP